MPGTYTATFAGYVNDDRVLAAISVPIAFAVPLPVLGNKLL